MVISLKRMDGTAKELSSFKKGKRFNNLPAAETELWFMSQSAPADGEGHRVAYDVELDGERYIGSFGLLYHERYQPAIELVSTVLVDYGIDLPNE